MIEVLGSSRTTVVKGYTFILMTPHSKIPVYAFLHNVAHADRHCSGLQILELQQPACLASQSEHAICWLNDLKQVFYLSVSQSSSIAHICRQYNAIITRWRIVSRQTEISLQSSMENSINKNGKLCFFLKFHNTLQTIDMLYDCSEAHHSGLII